MIVVAATDDMFLKVRPFQIVCFAFFVNTNTIYLRGVESFVLGSVQQNPEQTTIFVIRVIYIIRSHYCI